MAKRLLSCLTALALVLGLCTPLGGLVPAAEAAEAGSGTYEEIAWSYGDGVLTLSDGPLPAAPAEGASYPWADYAGEIWRLNLADVTSVQQGVFDDLPALEWIVFQGDTPPEFLDTTDNFVSADFFGRLYCPDTWDASYHEPPYWFTPYDTDRTGYCGAWQDEDETVYGENLTWKLEGDTLTISGQGEMANWGLGTDVPWAFYSEEIRRVVIGAGVISVGSCAFGLGSDNRPRSMTRSNASYPIETVDLGSTVQRLGRYAFADCRALASIELPSSIKEMEQSFSGCTGLTEVTFDPDAAVAYLYYAFSGCTGLTSVEIPASDPDYNPVDDPDGYLSYAYAFENCTSLTEVTFREGATLVDDGMFSGCTNLAEVHLPNSVETVYTDAFEDCGKLTDLYYDGYPDQWASVLETGFYELPGTVTVHCLEDKTAPHITMNDGSVHNKDFQIPAFVVDNRPEITVKCEWSVDGGMTWQALGGERIIHEDNDTLFWTVRVAGLTDGVLAVRVTATDFAGNQSTCMVEHILDFTPPEPPTGLAAEVKSSTEVSLTWDMPAEEANIYSFRVYSSTDGVDFDSRGGSSSNGMTVPYLEPGQTYYFRVAAVDTAGNEGEPSETVTATTWNDTTPPSVPVITPASGNTIGPRQTIKVYASDESSLDHVTVELQKEGETDWSPWDFSLSGASGSVSFTLEDLESGVYSLRARAADSSGNESGYSETITYTLDATPPAAFSVTAQVSQSDGQQVDLSWTSGGEADLAGFYLYRVTEGGSSTRIGSVSARAGQSDYTFTDRLSWDQCGGSYTYRVTATDRYGNQTAAVSNSVTPQAPQDTQAPTAALTAPATAFQGDALSFSAAGSSDDRGIVSYTWDFGDGKTAAGKSVHHTYAAGGTYTVTLTLQDNAGNATVQTQTVTVTAEADNALVTVTVLSQSGTPLRSAQVVYDLGGSNTSYYTDSDGRVTFRTTDSGTVEIGAYAADYLPASETVTLVHGYETELTLRLEQAPVVTGTLTSSELTYEEIKDLGIDTTAPENQNVYKFAAQIDIGGNLTEYTYYLNDAGGFVGPDIPVETVQVGDSDYTIRPHAVQVEREPEEPGDPVQVETISYVTVLRLPGTVSMLKQFFEAELTVLNQAGADFTFTGCTAELDIPDGLTLVPTAESAEQARVVLTAPEAETGTIPGQQSASAKWILRGDQAGQYRLEASFDGTLADFGLPIHADFQAEDSLEVRQSDEINLNMYVSNTMLDRIFYVDLELSCTTGDVNLPQLTLGDYEPAEMALIHPDESELILEETPEVLSAGDTLVYRYKIQLEEDIPLLYECNILEGQLDAGGLTANVATRNIRAFKLFTGDFDLTEMGVFIKTLPLLGDEPSEVTPAADAKAFWQFIFNKKDDPDPNDMYYRILLKDLNDYDGTLEELQLWILSMCQAVRARLNCYVKEDSERLGYLTQAMTDKLWEELEASGVTSDEALQEYTRKQLLNGVRDVFLKLDLSSATASALQGMTMACTSLSEAKDTMEQMIDAVHYGMLSLGIVLESEYTARYAYFNFYLNQRIDYEHPGEEIFRLLLDAKALQLKETYWTSQAIDTITWITGKESWMEHTGDIERWAEALYQFEVVALGYDSAGEPEGERVTLTYRSDHGADGQAVNKSCSLPVDWTWFERDGTDYSQSLATLTLGMTLAAFTDPNTDGLYGQQLAADDYRRAANIQAAYTALEFEDPVFLHYDDPLDDSTDKVAFSMAHRTLEDGSTLVALFLRGGGYGAEWAGNFLVEDEGDHAGFRLAAAEVADALTGYLDTLDAPGEVKLWMGGYSRSAAVANLAAQQLLDSNVVAADNLFAYTFATPNGRWEESDPAAEGSIFNIVSPHDVVPKVALESWGFSKYGKTLYLPMDNSQIENFFRRQTGEDLTVTAQTRLVTETVEDILSALVATRSQYVDHVQEPLRDILRETFQTSGSLPLGKAAALVKDVIELAFRENGDLMQELLAQRLYEDLEGVALFEDGMFPAAHDPDYYLAWMAAGRLDSIQNFTSQYIRTSLTVACPVDVEVYDGEGSLVASIVDNQVVTDLVPAAVWGDMKAVYLYDGDYTIRLTGTGTGSMDYTLRRYGDGGESEQVFRYYELPVTEDAVYTQEITHSAGAEPLKNPEGQDCVPDLETGGSQTTVSRYFVDVAGGTASQNLARPGETVTATAASPAAGKVFDHWTAESDAVGFALEDAEAETVRFSMPSGAVRLTAVYTDAPTGGTGSGSGGGGGSGSTGSGSGTEAEPEDPDIPLGALTFPDVPAGAWYEKAVAYVCEKGLMTGTGSETFSPDQNTTRGMIVTILYRLAGSPSVETGPDFRDVSAGMWYTDAVAWGSANGLVNGYGDGRFGPEDPITREQLAAFLYRYAMSQGEDVTVSGDLTAFTDGAEASGWAAEALAWAVERGILSGKGNGVLDPTGTATRAETAQMLMNAMENRKDEGVS